MTFHKWQMVHALAVLLAVISAASCSSQPTAMPSSQTIPPSDSGHVKAHADPLEVVAHALPYDESQKGFYRWRLPPDTRVLGCVRTIEAQGGYVQMGMDRPSIMGQRPQRWIEPCRTELVGADGTLYVCESRTIPVVMHPQYGLSILLRVYSPPESGQVKADIFYDAAGRPYPGPQVVPRKIRLIIEGRFVFEWP